MGVPRSNRGRGFSNIFKAFIAIFFMTIIEDNIAFLFRSEPHISLASSSIGNGEGVCNINYDSSGNIVSIGSEKASETKRINLVVQESGLLPLFYKRTDIVREDELGLETVMMSVRLYRKKSSLNISIYLLQTKGTREISNKIEFF